MSFPFDSFVCRPHVDANPDFILILFFGTTTIGDTHGVGPSAFSITPSFSSLGISSSISFLT